MAYREIFPHEIAEGFTQDGMSVVMMYDAQENYNIPIIIGSHEADMLYLEIEQRQVQRPMTHHLVSSLLDSFNLELKKVTIDKFWEGIFYATLHVSDGFSTKKMDARASDAIILSIHENVPILMESSIIDEVGFPAKKQPIDLDLELDDPDENNLSLLEEKLALLEEAEEYEEAARVQALINKIKGDF